jgi:hypothetical protein
MANRPRRGDPDKRLTPEDYAKSNFGKNNPKYKDFITKPDNEDENEESEDDLAEGAGFVGRQWHHQQNIEPRKHPLIYADINSKNIPEYYPWKSKVKYFHQNSIPPLQQKPLDFTRTPLEKKFQRPYFSPSPGSWEMDIVYAVHPENKNDAIYYLFVININTKYLRVFKLNNNIDRHKDITRCLNDLKMKGKKYISNLRADGEFRGFQYDGKLVYTSDSPFDNHNRVIDRVIRTIRDAIGPNYYNMRNLDLLRRVVRLYNNTPHLSLRIGKAIFTPVEVEDNKEIEGVLIRRNIELARVVQDQQFKNGLWSYQPGNIIMVHLDLSRTDYKFMKKRRIFNVLTKFLFYQHGNVVCKILESGIGKK